MNREENTQKKEVGTTQIKWYNYIMIWIILCFIALCITILLLLLKTIQQYEEEDQTNYADEFSRGIYSIHQDHNSIDRFSSF